MGPEDEFLDHLDLATDPGYLRILASGMGKSYYPNPTKSPDASVSLIAIDPKATDSRIEKTLLRKQIATRIRLDFEKKLSELRGSCYSTEVRDSGVFVCGNHHSLWNDADDSCVTMAEELTALSEVATGVLSSYSIESSDSSKAATKAQQRLRTLEDRARESASS